MTFSWWLTASVLAVGLTVAVLDRVAVGRPAGRVSWLTGAIGMYASAHLVWVVYVAVHHVGFPLHLDLMEGTVWQHFERAAAFQAVYPAPSPEYTPLAYNPLYYVLAVPFGWALGNTLATLRIVAIIGMVGSATVIYLVARDKTGSQWWGLVAAGLFAAAYRAMDTYLDNAHSDSWFLFAALLGTLVLGRSTTQAGRLAGTALLVASFWFKQHGALFVIGGLLGLTWRDGVRRSVPAWLLALVLGPVAYLAAGPLIFGSYFHYFTWQVPSGWSEYSPGLVRRFIAFIVKRYAVLAAAAGLFLGWAALTAWRDRRPLDIWQVQLVFALLTGLMGSLDAGSADNVYIPMGAWLILMGTVGCHALAAHASGLTRWQPAQLVLATSFALLAYDPRSVLSSPRAGESYADLIELLRGLNGAVYAPTQGQLAGDYRFYPAMHWVALDDITRGPRRGPDAQALADALLEPVLSPEGPAYILASQPIDFTAPVMAPLADAYELEADFGDRFEPLRVLPKRFDHGWPRYLYRLRPESGP